MNNRGYFVWDDDDNNSADAAAEYFRDMEQEEIRQKEAGLTLPTERDVQHYIFESHPSRARDSVQLQELKDTYGAKTLALLAQLIQNNMPWDLAREIVITWKGQ